MTMYPLLEKIKEAADIKRYSVTELERLAKELRAFIVETVAENGGHLAPSLGTVELTLALYSVFNFPKDKLIWDVGHQAYTHKILTGRRERFHTLRQKGGITGFPNRFESDYDAFGVGHASTSISAALGMAISRDLTGRNNEVIAVIGDGALTGGEAFEALNQAGDLGKKLIVILNDNEMSIDKNVGGLKKLINYEKGKTSPKLAIGMSILVLCLGMGGMYLAGFLCYGVIPYGAPVMVAPVPVPLAAVNLILLPVSTAIAENSIYLGCGVNAMKNRYLSVILPAFFFALQHSFIPTLPDIKFMVYRFLSFLPLTIVLCIIYRKNRNPMPIMIGHAVIDLSTAGMIMATSAVPGFYDMMTKL